MGLDPGPFFRPDGRPGQAWAEIFRVGPCSAQPEAREMLSYSYGLGPVSNRLGLGT
jgi:hypothetical protein